MEEAMLTLRQTMRSLCLTLLTLRWKIYLAERLVTGVPVQICCRSFRCEKAPTMSARLAKRLQKRMALDNTAAMGRFRWSPQGFSEFFALTQRVRCAGCNTWYATAYFVPIGGHDLTGVAYEW